MTFFAIEEHNVNSTFEIYLNRVYSAAALICCFYKLAKDSQFSNKASIDDREIFHMIWIQFSFILAGSVAVYMKLKLLLYNREQFQLDFFHDAQLPIFLSILGFIVLFASLAISLSVYGKFYAKQRKLSDKLNLR